MGAPASIYDEADELRDDIEILNVMIDAALDTRAGRPTLGAISAVLRERRERLRRLEQRAARVHAPE